VLLVRLVFVENKNFVFLFKKGNLIVLIVALRKQNYKFVTNCYIINLAITDLLFLLISVPLTAHLGFTNTWILSAFINCQIQIYIAHVNLFKSKIKLIIFKIGSSSNNMLYISSHEY
jgi:inner membrane protein involved in colicin E2 resistance